MSVLRTVKEWLKDFELEVIVNRRREVYKILAEDARLEASDLDKVFDETGHEGVRRLANVRRGEARKLQAIADELDEDLYSQEYGPERE